MVRMLMGKRGVKRERAVALLNKATVLVALADHLPPWDLSARSRPCGWAEIYRFEKARAALIKQVLDCGAELIANAKRGAQSSPPAYPIGPH
jgi:hypothetical protein